ncbi:Zinc finger and BTB domain-containing protein 24 [Frankliniella fusca]|uniref:Zinc finger and BTB domain-containing protein 24 n=1 Tax=Frankliniella fusca TaxID=407009 RepID=A0AAE1LET6_9NEOP|nr:Zinc finger and BTB domain-containing protein 24 [Frankliniella fusca]
MEPEESVLEPEGSVLEPEESVLEPEESVLEQGGDRAGARGKRAGARGKRAGAGRKRAAAGRERAAAGRERAAAGRERAAAGRERAAAGGEKGGAGSAGRPRQWLAKKQIPRDRVALGWRVGEGGGDSEEGKFKVCLGDPLKSDWTMQLKFVTDRDAGRYECQVSSHPPVSNYIHLKVVAAAGYLDVDQ